MKILLNVHIMCIHTHTHAHTLIESVQPYNIMWRMFSIVSIVAVQHNFLICTSVLASMDAYCIAGSNLPKGVPKLNSNTITLKWLYNIMWQTLNQII